MSQLTVAAEPTVRKACKPLLAELSKNVIARQILSLHNGFSNPPLPNLLRFANNQQHDLHNFPLF